RLQSGRGFRWLIAVVLSVPFVYYGQSSPRINWFDFSMLADAVDGCLALAAVALLLLVARNLGRARPGRSSARSTSREVRSVAVLIAIVGLLTPTATVAAIPMAFMIGWALIELLLLPIRPYSAGTQVQPSKVSRQDAIEAIAGQAREAAEMRAIGLL